MPKAFHHPSRALVAYVLLASVYLLYLPYAEFVLDDWFVLGKYEAARAGGPAELGRVALAIVQNQFHGQFRFQWLSFLLGYLEWLAVGYSPKTVLLVSLGLHVACALALRAAVAKLGLGEAAGFLAGALFLVLPTTHGALLWSFNCAFFLWSTLWFLLYLEAVAARRGVGRQVVFLLLALFSGDPVFVLLLAAPVVAWRGWRPLAVGWVTAAAAVAVYATLVNRAPVFQAGLNVRYAFTPQAAWATLATVGRVYRKLTGLTADSYYRVELTVWAVAAAVVVGWCLWRMPAEKLPWARVWLPAAGLWLAAYGPILLLRAHEFRYDYVPSPYLALGLAAAALAWPRGRWATGAALAGWLAAASVADLEQSWKPQSERLRAIGTKLRAAPVEKGETILVSNTVLWIGTAPHFAYFAGWASTPYAEHETGVRGIEAACDIVDEGDALRVRHRNYQRDWKPEESRRTRVLVARRDGRLEERRLLAHRVGDGGYRVYPLKGYAGPPAPEGVVERDQLALLEGEIYFVERDTH